MLGFHSDVKLGEHTIWFTEDCCTHILERFKSGLGKEIIEKRASLLRSFVLILKNDKCIYFCPSWEGTVISMQPGVGQGAKNILLHRNKPLFFGYPPPPKTANKKSNTVQGISHWMATLHQSYDKCSHGIGGIITGEGK